jgi:hypothetical protein
MVSSTTIIDMRTTAATIIKRSWLKLLMITMKPLVETKQIKTSYSTAAATAFVEFDNVKVPVQNLLGEPKTMRWLDHFMVSSTTIIDMRTTAATIIKRSWLKFHCRSSLLTLDRIARMISLAESNQAWLESIAYQMNNWLFNQLLAKDDALVRPFHGLFHNHH